MDSSVEALAQLAGGMQDTSALQTFITKTIHPETAAALGKGDIIADGVDSELDELRGISRGGKQYLLRSLKEQLGL